MRLILPVIMLAAVLSTPAHAQEQPDPAKMRATVEKLVSFGTRHTMSDPDSDTRGIGAARRWAANRLNAISDACDGCINVANIARTFTGRRSPDGVKVVDVLGFQQGTDSHRVVIVMGHIDSRVTDGMNATSDAPGANDDASGVAVVLEAARILSKEKFKATIVYAITSGEEQGLWGAQLLADTAKARGWTISGVLNNDIVGGTTGTDGTRVTDRVRVFSEGLSDAATPDQMKMLRAIGGEDDGLSRSLAKTIRGVAAGIPDGLKVMIVRRPDRFGRGGDQLPFEKFGYPAVRFSAGIENYHQQHQDLRTENGIEYGDTPDKMDFPYLAKVAAINVATIRQLASAPAAPDKVTISGAVSSDTTVEWAPVKEAKSYRVYWRPADQPYWTQHRDVAGTSVTLKGVIIDDNFFGVSAIADDGAESRVSFAGPKPR